MSLRSGLTTGTCAAAAAKAAALVLAGGEAPRDVELQLPSGQAVRVPILHVEPRADGAAATAVVRKDAGDDPDATHGLEIRVTVAWDDQADVAFVAGEGVGTVTKPGLQIPPGQPAINPVPRQMITAAIRAVTSRGVRVEVAIPGGREVATRTFNPRLGIAGGLSILGTTGVVRPYCVSALRDALTCSLDVAAACGETAVVFVPGNIGARSARQHFFLREEQVIEVGNEWGFLLDELVSPRLSTPGRGVGGEGSRAFHALLVLGHPGKLAKLGDRQWDTHSARSPPPLETIRRLCSSLPTAQNTTVEGLFAALPPPERKSLAEALAGRIRTAVSQRIGTRLPVAVFLVNMVGECLGTAGDLGPWR
ncbi:MAG: cobalt-precorrin-5B (C(1))-methyltransferase CbiD [Planctomycetota bacterium]|nr:cobalt-precorrin-5B (C(1))-methyltransferase CbiD [Planctomycetota bacterium]